MFKRGPHPKPIFSVADEIGEVKVGGVKKRKQAEFTVEEDKALVVEHLQNMEEFFADALVSELARISEKYGDVVPHIDFGNQPFRVSTEYARKIVSEMREIGRVREMANLIRKGGRGLYPNQIRTLVRSMLEATMCLSKPGIVLGPMQSGKTGLALAHAMFLAPIIYSMTGVKLFPLFLSTNLTRNKNQTADELTDCLKLYGDVDVVVNESNISVNNFYGDVLGLFRERFSSNNGWMQEEIADEFGASPTPKTFDREILRDRDAELYLPRSIDARELDIVEGRTTGSNVAAIRHRIACAKQAGFSILFLIDEPQFGASGKLVATGKEDKFGREKHSGNVLRQILVDINNDIQDAGSRHMAIGFSATPFDTAYHENFWVAPAVLSPNYIGPNVWAGEKIDPDAWHQPPNLSSLEDIEAATGNGNISRIPALMGISRSKKRLTLIDFDAGREAFRAVVEWMMAQREVVREEIEDKRPEHAGVLSEMMSRPSGGIVRFTTGNGNRKSDFDGATQIIDRLELEKDFQVIRYFGDHCEDEDGRALTAQEIMDNPKYYDPNDPRPPLFVPTASMRMADNLPKIIEWGIDFSASEGDNNSNLQGIFGRLCGDSKFLSRIALGEKAASSLRAYLVDGRPHGKSSAHSDVYFGAPRGRGTRLRKLDLMHEDPVMNEFIDKINDTIIAERFGYELRRTLIVKKSPRFKEFPGIISGTRAADGRSLVEYLNDPVVQNKYWPQYENAVIINPLDPEDTMEHTDKDGKVMDLHYDNDPDHGFLVSFRLRPTNQRDEGHYGKTSRGARRDAKSGGQTDRVVGSRVGEKAALEMQINCFLADEHGVEIAQDENGKYVEDGYPIAYMVTMALKAEAKGRYPQTDDAMSLARPDSWHQNFSEREHQWMMEVEMARQAAREARGEARAAREARKAEATTAAKPRAKRATAKGL